jgi:long-subunit acyl-CoA synthetase (AMP-forming)
MTSRPPLAGFRLAPAASIEDGDRCWDRAQLEQAIGGLAGILVAQGTRVMATLMDNSPAWVVCDAAAARAGVVHVPLPVFFTPAQVTHALASAGVDTMLASPAAATAFRGAPASRCDVAGQELVLARLPATAAPLPPGTAKITFTSGTTGTPKGVCLRQDAMQRVADSLVQALEPLGIRRHLCALPLAVLLENIAGVMAPLARGAACIVPPLGQVGLCGSSGFDAAAFQSALVRHRPDSVILLPQMLRAWVEYLRGQGLLAPAGLKMVAVGGAAVGARLIGEARALGIPAYEGYGLSEGASVQALNLPGGDRPGSCGRALPHARLRIAPDGEIEIAGSLLAGYLGDSASPPGWWPTGDLGSVDADGFVYVQGRKKNVLVTGFGRNVAPEWVETTLRGEACVSQAAVFGDGQPALAAVLWPVGDVPDACLQAAVDAANRTLPDYARIARWVRARAAFDAASGMATANGRPQRGAILQSHADALGIPPAAEAPPENR